MNYDSMEMALAKYIRVNKENKMRESNESAAEAALMFQFV